MKEIIKINLNQTISRAQLDYIQEEKKRWIIFGVICSFFTIYLFWFLFINSRMNYVIENRQKTIATIEKNTEDLKKRGKINL